MTGGIAALMGAFFLGPRIGKYDENGNPRAIPGHSIPFAMLGVFILWVGWFGFNPGSELLADEFVLDDRRQHDARRCRRRSCNDHHDLARRRQAGPRHDRQRRARRPRRDHRPVWHGHRRHVGRHRRIGGVIVVFAVLFFDKIKIDDPVGAISVHGVCGAWGLLSVGLFAQYRRCLPRSRSAKNHRFRPVLRWRHRPARRPGHSCSPSSAPGSTVTSGILFFVLKKTIGLRVSRRGRDRGPRRPRARPPGLRPRHGSHELTPSSDDRLTKEPTHETRDSGHQAVQAR